MMKIGILSLVYQNWNFGGLLQGYALEKVVQRICPTSAQIRVSRTMIDRSIKGMVASVMKSNRFFAEITNFLGHIKDPRNLKNFRNFQNQYIDLESFCNPVNAKKLNEGYDCFITGSDQVWNPQKMGVQAVEMFGLLFAERKKKKIAYAASIGAEQLVPLYEKLFKKILDNMDHISVREESAKAALQPMTRKEIHVVLDPVMLLTAEEWEKVAKVPETDEPYVFCYFLGEPKNRHNEQFKAIANILGRKVRCISGEQNLYVREQDMEILDAGPREFIGNIYGAETVFVNSFHGTVFSIVFHKNFWVFCRDKQSVYNSANSRIIDLLRMFGLENRIINDGDIPSFEKLQQPIDYQKVDAILEKKQSESLAWLTNAIDS